MPGAFRCPRRRALWWSVGPSGEPAVLLVHRRHLKRYRCVKGWVGRSVDTPFTGELVIADGQDERRTPVKDVRVRPCHLALLPGSRFLLAGGRTVRADAGDAWMPNAAMFSASRTPEADFCIGDDIPVLVTDRDGGIWTAYGDEGVYGGHPESAGGLAGWTQEGHVRWLPQGRLPDAPLEGCTAATDGDRVWLVWYSGGCRGGTYLTRITPSTGEVTSCPARSPILTGSRFATRTPYSPPAITTGVPPNSSTPNWTATAGR